MAGNTVTFEPGARTAWHTHPLGQVLIVTAGLTHIALQEAQDGRAVVWLEHVSEEAYRAGHDE